MEGEQRPKSLISALEAFTTDTADLMVTTQASLNKKEVELVETQISAFHKEAENIKLKVEECASARETVNEILPSMREKAAELEELFAIIDSLESYVKHVDECVTAMENRCSMIEQAQGGNILSRKLGSFFSAFSSGEKKKKRPVVPLWSAEQAVPRADELIDTAPTLPAE